MLLSKNKKTTGKFNINVYKVLYGMFIVFVVITILFFLLIKTLTDNDYSFADRDIFDWSEEWAINYNRQPTQLIDLPNKIDADQDTVIVLKKTLPKTIKRYNCLMLESKRQDIMVHVGGVLRSTYSDKEDRVVGNSSPSAILLVPLYSSDGGADISVTITSNTYFAGDINRIFLGNEMSIILMLIKNNVLWLFLDAIILIIGLVCLACYYIYRKSYDEGNSLIHLFWVSLLAVVFCFSRARMRQMFIGDLALFENMGYCCFMLLVCPICGYADQVTKKKYNKVFVCYEAIGLINFVLQNVMQLYTVFDFFEMEIITNILFVIMMLIAIAIIFSSSIARKDRSVRYLLFSLIAVEIGMVEETINKALHYSQSTNKFFVICILVFLGTNLLYNFLNIQNEQQQRKDAESANQAKSQFLATMSHEIRTPINAVLGMNEMILRESKETNIREYADNISDAGKSLLSLVNDILDFSKIEAGKMDIIPVEYQLKHLLRDIILMGKNLAEKKELLLKLDIDEDIPSKYFGDEVRLKQILTNLLTNAVKYTHSGSVLLTVKNKGIEGDNINLYFSVKDTGIGIKTEDISKLSQSFVRIEERRNRNIEGTGLGLSITGQLLNLMGSELELHSEYGSGSDFFFTLRQKIVAVEPMGPVMSKDVSREKRKGFTFTAPEARILAVDDNRMNLTVLKGLLKPTKIQITTCMSGPECLELCQGQYFDVILMDHMMPEMDGIETTKRIRENPECSCTDTKIVALTANAISGAEEMYMQNGFDGYLTKPIEIMELDTCLKKNIIPELIFEE